MCNSFISTSQDIVDIANLVLRRNTRMDKHTDGQRDYYTEDIPHVWTLKLLF